MTAVLHVAACPFPLGQGSQVLVAGLTRALARRGHDVHVAAYGHGEGAWPEGVGRVAGPAPRVLRRDASGPHLGKPLLDLALAAAVARHLARSPVDVVHAHNVEAPFVGWLASRLARRRVPLVYHLHTALEEELPTYGPAWARPVAGRFGRAVDATLSRHADAAIALSSRSEALLRGHGARRVVRIPPGVDVAELEGGDPGRARERLALGERPWVAYTGNADPYQDLDVLFAAVGRLPEAGLVVVGPSPEEQVRRRAAAAGLGAERLRVLQSAALADALDVLAACRVAAVPRAVCAGFPMKILNVLGAGRACVVAEDAAPPVEGVLRFPGGDVGALAGALAACLASPDMTERLGVAGARAVRAGWSWEVRAAETERLYADLALAPVRHE